MKNKDLLKTCLNMAVIVASELYTRRRMDASSILITLHPLILFHFPTLHFFLPSILSKVLTKKSSRFNFDNMGSAFSFLISHPNNNSTNPCLGDLPESCVASVLMYLNPQEICKLGMLNRAFRGASFADFVWESKLPVNYLSIIQRLLDDDDDDGQQGNSLIGDLCKRDIYSWLSRPNSFDHGTKKVWLDKRSGKVCLAIASNGLEITGIDDRRYWSRMSTADSRFGSVAYVQQIWWFEVDGEVEFPFPPGSYSLFIRLHLGRSGKRFGRRVCNVDHVHGWDIKPVRFQISDSGKQQTTTQCYLTEEPGKWNYYHMGDFNVVNSNRSTKVKFSMTQIDCTHTKGGLCVDSVIVCPSEFKGRLHSF